MGAFELRLLALGFPEARAFDGSTERQLVTLASWLEDRVVRSRPVEERGPLRAGAPGAIQAYLEELEAPESVAAELKAQRYASVCSWLTLTALQCSCEDLDAASAPAGPEASLQSLAAAHGVAHNPRDRAGTLQAALLAARARESGGGGAGGGADGSASAAANAKTRADFPLGFETGDAKLDDAARGLRMLYVAELRQLQTSFNGVVTCAQEFTANPKTDSQLGRVGR